MAEQAQTAVKNPILAVIAPAKEGNVRLRFPLTGNEIKTVQIFRPSALQVSEGEGNDSRVVFQVALSNKAEIGKYGLSVPDTKDEKFMGLISLPNGGSEAFYATLANANGHIATVVKQAKAAIKAYNDAKATVVEE